MRTGGSARNATTCDGSMARGAARCARRRWSAPGGVVVVQLGRTFRGLIDGFDDDTFTLLCVITSPRLTV